MIADILFGMDATDEASEEESAQAFEAAPAPRAPESAALPEALPEALQEALREESASARGRVVAEGADGSAVRMVPDGKGSESIHVHAPDGALIFEYRPSEGRSVIYAPTGALEVAAPEGDLSLTAGRAVRIRGESGVSIESASHVDLHVKSETQEARLGLDDQRLGVEVEEIRARTEQAHLESDRASVRSRLLSTTAELLKSTAGFLETTAGQLVERAKESYRDVEGLSQTRAGRIRLVAEETFRVLGERTLLKAKKDMKLKGEMIYLD